MTTSPTTADVDHARVPASSVPGKAFFLIRVNGSDLSAIRTEGTNLTTCIASVWRWGKAEVNHLLSKAYISTRPFPFPYDIIEMIITYLVRDIDTLKACSLTCRSWYSATAPLLHHTLTLTGGRPKVGRSQPELLFKLRELGLTPLVKGVRIRQSYRGGGWFVPGASSHLPLRYFSAFANIHTLRVYKLDIHLFIPEIEHYFKHFSQTLRSITLFDPKGTPRQLSHFLSLFTNLENIDIHGADKYTTIPDLDTKLVPFSAPKLRGRLSLHGFSWVETWAHLIAWCGGLRFRYMDLRWSTNCAPILLGACAETLETLRFDVMDSEFCIGFSMDSN